MIHRLFRLQTIVAKRSWRFNFINLNLISILRIENMKWDAYTFQQAQID